MRELNLDDDTPGNYEFTQSEKDVRLKILHLLSIFPRISPSMLQIGIGPSIPTSLWRPVFNAMLESKEVYSHSHQAATPKGRVQVYQVITTEPNLK